MKYRYSLENFEDKEEENDSALVEKQSQSIQWFRCKSFEKESQMEVKIEDVQDIHFGSKEVLRYVDLKQKL